jgi:mannobiose 2-epimerase
MDELQRLRTEVLEELTGNILPFTMRFVVDWEQGGFYGLVANNRAVNREAPKGLVQHSRTLWAFAHAYRTLQDPQFLPFVTHARTALLDRFWDPEYGGFFWMLDYRGQPLHPGKLTYGQAFALYGLAEDYIATGCAESFGRARQTYGLLEKHGRDLEYGGYWEAHYQDWVRAPEQRVDPTDLPVSKGMNTHLHMLEAYTNLLRVWDDDGVRSRLCALIYIMLERVLNPETDHLNLFFDREWRSLADGISYGHDIEASWLLVEAAAVLGEEGLQSRAEQAALRMAYATLEQGIGADGGVFDEGDPSGVVGRGRSWWPQAEAMIGFLNAYQLNGDPRLLAASLASWRFVQQHIVDREYGDWFWGVDEAGCPCDREKAGPWKAIYHSGRACLEVMRRIQELAGKS